MKRLCLRPKLLHLMIMIAVIAAALGVVHAFRLKIRRDQFKRIAQDYSSLEEYEREVHSVLSKSAYSDEKIVATSARNALLKERDLSERWGRKRYAARYPGHSGGYNDPTDVLTYVKGLTADVDDMIDRDFKEGAIKRRERMKLAEAKIHYYSLLKEKYERAAECPWLSLTPDPETPGE